MPLRIAIVSTPRTGSTWLRLLLTEAYAIPGMAVARPDGLDWAGLPEECVLQLHARRTTSLLERLRLEGFHVVSVMRHPLDVLISILQFCSHDDSTLQWLNGAGGDERSIQGAMPGSAAFLEYAAGPRAAALLEVSREWALAPESIPVRYEELVADVQGELARIAEALKTPLRRQSAEVAEEATIPKLRVRTGVSHHFWQGRCDLWRSLLVSPTVERVAAAHHACCVELGYSCAANPLLDAVQADANWLALVWPQVTEKLRAHRRMGQELVESRSQTSLLEAECAAAARQNAALATNNAELILKNGELAKDATELIQKNEQWAKDNGELAEAKAELERQYAELAAQYAELTKHWNAAVKGYQELRDYCTFVEDAYKHTHAICQEILKARQADQVRLQGMGPRSLAMARWLTGLSNRFPATASAMKRALHLNARES